MVINEIRDLKNLNSAGGVSMQETTWKEIIEAINEYKENK